MSCWKSSWRCWCALCWSISDLRIAVNNDDKASVATTPTAGAECADDSKEDCKSKGSRPQGVRRRMGRCVLHLPPSHAAAAPSSTWCACSGTRSSPESRRDAGLRRCCAAPAPTGSGTSGSCAPTSAAAAAWKRCGCDDSSPWTSETSPDVEPSPPACSFHQMDAPWIHLWEILLKAEFRNKSTCGSHEKATASISMRVWII